MVIKKTSNNTITTSNRNKQYNGEKTQLTTTTDVNSHHCNKKGKNIIKNIEKIVYHIEPSIKNTLISIGIKPNKSSVRKLNYHTAVDREITLSKYTNIFRNHKNNS